MHCGKKIGLVLAGGIAKGAYQLGVLNAFSELLPEDFFDYISTSSVGCLNGYTYCEKQLEECRSVWNKINFKGALSFAHDFYEKGYIDQIFAPFKKRANPLKHNLYVSLFSLPDKHLRYVNLRNIPSEEYFDYLKAGVSLYPFAKPVKINGLKYYDGAMVDNIPTFPLADKNLDLVIVVYFDKDSFLFENEDFNKKVLRINFMERKIIHDSFSFDPTSVEEKVSIGKETAKNIIKEYGLNKELTDERMAEIYRKINEKWISSGDQKSKHITGDIFVAGFNKVTRRLLKSEAILDENSCDGKLLIQD